MNVIIDKLIYHFLLVLSLRTWSWNISVNLCQVVLQWWHLQMKLLNS